MKWAMKFKFWSPGSQHLVAAKVWNKHASLHLQGRAEDGASRFLQVVAVCLQNYILT